MAFGNRRTGLLGMLWLVLILFIQVFRSSFGFLAGNLCLPSLDFAGVEIFSFFFFLNKNKIKIGIASGTRTKRWLRGGLGLLD